MSDKRCRCTVVGSSKQEEGEILEIKASENQNLLLSLTYTIIYIYICVYIYICIYIYII